MKKKSVTKIDRVINALLKNKLTRKQIASRFNIPNVRAILFDIRRKGYSIVDDGRYVAVA